MVGRKPPHEQRTTINEQQMNINRHNYEAFFLLYVDKELSAADRRAVDLFVQENPDLKIELQMLQQTVVQADDIVLDKKDWLLMEEDVSAMQENLLLYADDELNAADKKLIESLLATDKAVQTEWNILKQTKLRPDATVVFDDKRSLYRTAGTRVVAFKWWRIAAAALLFGFGIWGGIAMYKNSLTVNANDGGLVENKTTEKAQPQSNSDVKTIAVPESTQENNIAADNIAATAQMKEQSSETNINKQAVEINNVQNKTTVSTKRLQNESITVQKSTNKIPDNNLPKPYFENINNSSSNKTIATNVIPSNNNNSRVSGNNVDIVKTNPIERMTNTNVATNNNNSVASTSINAIQVASNKAADAGNNSYLNLDDDKEKRTGLGGFLRKAKRVIERTTNINTGEGIKVAGFEIALK